MATTNARKIIKTYKTDKVNTLNILRSMYPNIDVFTPNKQYHVGDLIYRVDKLNVIIYTAVKDSNAGSFVSSNWKVFKVSSLSDAYMLGTDNTVNIPAPTLPDDPDLDDYTTPGTYYLTSAITNYNDIPIELRGSTLGAKLIIEHVTGNDSTMQRLILDDGTEYARTIGNDWHHEWHRMHAEYVHPYVFGERIVKMYVSPTGNDTTGNGTSTAPYATVERLLRKMPRDLNGCIYEIRIKNSGTSTTPAVLNGGFFIDGFHNGTLYIMNDNVHSDISTIQTSVTRAKELQINGAVKIINCTANIIVNDITIKGTPIASLVPALFIENAVNVEITRCIVDGKHGSTIIKQGVDTKMSIVEINQCIIRNFSDYGVYARTVSHIIVQDVEIDGNSNTNLGCAFSSYTSILHLTDIVYGNNITVKYNSEHGGRIFDGAQTNVPFY